LAEVACVAKPDTILSWYRRLVAQKFDGSKKPTVSRPPSLHRKSRLLVVRMARENTSWGYDRIAGAMANLGHTVSDQTVGNHSAPARNRFRRPAGPGYCRLFGAIELLRNQPAIPAQDSVGFGDAGHFGQRLSAQPLPDLGERGAFRITQAQSRGQLRPQNTEFSAPRYSFRGSSSRFTDPLTYASSRAHFWFHIPPLIVHLAILGRVF